MRKFLLPAAIIVVASVVGVSWWYLSRDIDGSPSRSETANQPTHQLEQSGFEDTKTPGAVEHGTLTPEGVQSMSPFAPEHTILNIDCRMVSGKGAARGVAVLTLPTEDGVVFSVMDESGELTRGELDFRPNHVRIGRRPDGSTVYGFGDLRLNSKVFRPGDSDEPVRIYHDDLVIYETDKAWDFGVSHDASSFFAHEPSPGGTSRLIVRNLERGTQVEHELGPALTPVSDYSMEHASGYSLDGSEIVFRPAHADAAGNGVYWFYPVGDGRVRRVTVERYWAALLTSSEYGYYVDRPDDLDPEEVGDVWEVTARRLDPSTGDSADLWSTRLSVRKHYGLLSLSENGKWLGLSGWDYKVLDTENGETIFDFPYAGNPEAQLARLAPILAEGATEADLGTLSHMRFRGNYLVGYRIVGDASSCSKKSGGERLECLRDLRLRGLYGNFFDVYDMSTIELNGSPSFTTEVYRESTCMPASSGWKGLVELNGKLAFQPVRTIENVDESER
ncbi:MAG: hypothetical protein OXG24_04005 [Gammaproteobacteria bacterium]|nr:hypothetical protein [Gammaproteobacteria bacterium]